MDQLKPAELQNSMESLLSTLKCPVCLVLLEKDSVLCVNGHAICKKCRGNQNTCPTCRNSFSNLQQNVIISQVLENLPHTCRFEKCSHLVKSNDDHETYCRFRPTKCNYLGCQWIGASENLSFHLEDKHPKEKVFSGTRNLVKISKSYMDSNATLLFSAYGHYFWQFVSNVTASFENESLVKFTYLPLFVGKPARDIYIRIWFKSEEKEYDAGTKIKMNQNDNAGITNRFIFPTSVISNFYNGNELKYNLSITEERNEAINILLE